MTRKEKNLLLAAIEGDVKRIERILAPNVDPSLIFFNGWSLLHIAAHYNQDDLSQWLLERNVDVNIPNMHRATPLHICTYAGSDKVAELLINARARMDNPDAYGWLPLGITAWHGFSDIALKLVNGGCDISQRGANGQTALHYAAWNNYTDVVQLLMNAGASTSIANDDSFTPVDLAWQNQSLESLRIMAPQKYESLLDHVQKVWGTHSASIIPRRIGQDTLDYVQNALLEADQDNFLSSSRRKRERKYNHITLSGVAVASRSEVVIANMLHSFRMAFEYKAVSANQPILRQVRPSFLFRISGGIEIAWDHVERNKEEDFDGYLAQRIQRFVNAGFKLGENYFVSFDDAKGSLDSTKIRNYINTIGHRIRIAEARNQLRSDGGLAIDTNRSAITESRTDDYEEDKLGHSYVDIDEQDTSKASNYLTDAKLSSEPTEENNKGSSGRAPQAPPTTGPSAAMLDLEKVTAKVNDDKVEVIPAERANGSDSDDIDIPPINNTTGAGGASSARTGPTVVHRFLDGH